MEVLHDFVSGLEFITRMHVKFYMYENLTAAGNFNKIFLINIQNLNAANIIEYL